MNGKEYDKYIELLASFGRQLKASEEDSYLISPSDESYIYATKLIKSNNIQIAGKKIYLNCEDGIISKDMIMLAKFITLFAKALCEKDNPKNENALCADFAILDVLIK